MLAKQLINRLENMGLLAPEILDELRRQLSDSKSRVTPEAIAKLLVENGHLTKFQATKVIAELKSVMDDAGADEKANVASVVSSPKSKADDLGLAPLDGFDDDIIEVAEVDDSQPKQATVFLDDDDDVADVVEVVDVVDAVEVIEEVVEVVPADAQPAKAATRAAAAPKPPAAPKAPRTPRKTTAPAKSQWDTGRIVVVGFVLLVLLLALGWLGWWFIRGNADEFMKRANDKYEARDYEASAKIYEDFVQTFSTDDRVSDAKVRIALAKLRDAADRGADPNMALQVAQTELPRIVDEPALPRELGDLTDVLLSVAEKFNRRADGAKTTEEKRATMEQMDALRELINNPQYVGAAQRTQQETIIARIEEDRQRILRDINRDDELAKSITKIQASLEARDTSAAYDVRRELIRRYPQLESDSTLNDLVQKATGIQKELVKPSANRPQVSNTEPSSDIARSVILANLTGKPVADLRGTLIYVRAKASVYGLDGETGSVKWRRYVGHELLADPQRFTSDAASDVLVTMSEKGMLQRLKGSDGSLVWQVQLSGPCVTPTLVNDDLIVATIAGEVTSLDTVTGQPKWSVQLPQPIAVSPGFASRGEYCYIPGEHSNLYVLAKRSGDCAEVFYTGHLPGTISVPPTIVMDQIFIFENSRPNFCSIRVLQGNEKGSDLKVVQSGISATGSVVVPPQVASRRLFVTSDLGEINVLDVEPTAEKNKVSSIAKVVASENSPRLMWPAVDKNELWIASERLAKFEVQIARSQLVRLWIKDDGDQFTGTPQVYGNVVVHARKTRGTLGVRVAAVGRDSGEPIWQTDLGVPVALLTGSPDASGNTTEFQAVTSQAALYQIDRQAIQTGAVAAAKENPGMGGKLLIFANPVALQDGRTVLLNQTTGNQIAVYDPAAQVSKLRLVTLNTGTGRPTATPVVAGNSLIVPLSTGQVMAFDPTTGSQSASPFFPPLQPGSEVEWPTPAVSPDGQTLWVADPRAKLYRVALGAQMRTLAESDMPIPLQKQIGLVGNSVIGYVATSSGDVLKIYDGNGLKETLSTPLTGRVVWGPYTTDSAALLATDNEGLMAVGAEGNVLWKAEVPKLKWLPPGKIVEGDIYLAAITGEVIRVNLTSGKIIASGNAGEPLSGAPFPTRSVTLVPGDEGSVLAIRLSDRTEEGQPE